MNSLESKMFFLPNRLYVEQDRLFVYFNLEAIPGNINVSSVVFHLPLPKMFTPKVIIIKEIAARWSEKSVRQGAFPPCINFKWLYCSPKQDQLIIDITALQRKWSSKKRRNHGIYVKSKSKENFHFHQEEPPYLIIDTL